MKRIILLVLSASAIFLWGAYAFVTPPNSPKRKNALALEAPTYETRKVDGVKTFILLDKSGGHVDTVEDMNRWLDNLPPSIELQKGHIVEDEIKGFESHTYYYTESIRGAPKK